MNTVGIHLDQVGFRYGDTELFFDIEIEAAAITAVMGPSGSGKSTMLNLIAGFETPERGIILIAGADVTQMRPSERPVSMIFQENNLLGHLSVEQNVGLGRSPALKLSREDRASIADGLARTGLAGKERRLPRELSGGERQRVAIARALVRRRPVLLLDEPFAALGPALRIEMLDLVQALQVEHGLTVLLVSHQPDDALRIAKSMVFVENGRVAASGPIGEFFGGIGPATFRHYIGKTDDSAEMPPTARRPT